MARLKGYVGLWLLFVCFAAPAAADDPTAAAQTACAVAAVTEFNTANLALLKSQPVMSIDTQIAQRRLQEGYCLKYAHCLIDVLKIAEADLALSAEFSHCLDEGAQAGK